MQYADLYRFCSKLNLFVIFRKFPPFSHLFSLVFLHTLPWSTRCSWCWPLFWVDMINSLSNPAKSQMNFIIMTMDCLIYNPAACMTGIFECLSAAAREGCDLRIDSSRRYWNVWAQCKVGQDLTKQNKTTSKGSKVFHHVSYYKVLSCDVWSLRNHVDGVKRFIIVHHLASGYFRVTCGEA